jgi:hypothetical protein
VGEHAVALLRVFTGISRTDGYAAYRSLAGPKGAGGPDTLAFVGRIGGASSSTLPNRRQRRS